MPLLWQNDKGGEAMKNLKGRAKTRGQQLDKDCYNAHISVHEYGMEDKRTFCYGQFDCMKDETLQKCTICGAYVNNAKPIESEVEE